MPPVAQAGPLYLTAPLALAGWLAGVCALAFLDSRIGRPAAASPEPGMIASAVRLVLKERRATEAPDDPAWLAGPVLLAAVSAAALVVVPAGPGLVLADLNVGIVAFSGLVIVALVAVFLTGWGPNSKLPMIAGFRFVGIVLAYGSAFAVTIISVALPAESLAIGDIVAVQHAGVWNAVLQPAGFVLYLVLGQAIAFWGPLDSVTSRDLAGGVGAELSGAQALLFRIGRYGMLLAVAAFAVPCFLGGWHGPLLPPAAWTLVKTGAVAMLLIGMRRLVPVVRTERFMKIGWTVLLPASLANVFLVGLILLLVPGIGRAS